MFFLFLQKIKNVILDALFPPLCLNCERVLDKNEGGESGPICGDCLSSIRLNNTLFCGTCRARLPEGRKICHKDAPYLLAAAGNYDDAALRNLIQFFKYKSWENLSPVLGGILNRYLDYLIGNSELEIRNFVIVPIPLHNVRQRQRGFNQAALLAKIVGKNFELEVKSFLIRNKNNKPQVNLKDIEERRKNMENCFSVVNGADIAGKNILLIDDVSTSGATLDEAAQVLKQNGARKIIGLVLAKA